MTFEELNTLVVQWAKDRQIVPNSNPTAQLMKTMSELGELADATLKTDWAEIEDGVGDVLVTLILYCKLQDISVVDCLQRAYDTIKDRKGTLTPEGIFVKEETATAKPVDETEGEELKGQFFSDTCPKKSESARKSADTKAYDDVPTRRDMTFTQRLALGFEMLDEDDHPDDAEV